MIQAAGDDTGISAQKAALDTGLAAKKEDKAADPAKAAATAAYATQAKTRVKKAIEAAYTAKPAGSSFCGDRRTHCHRGLAPSSPATPIQSPQKD